MPDNSAEIARLQAMLNSGVRSTSADGQSMTLDPDSIREQIRQLRASDTTQRRNRPICSNVNLGGCK